MNRYETHLTLNSSSIEDTEHVRQWAVDHDLKWSLIELASGEIPLQPMLTFWGHGSVDDQLHRAETLIRGVEVQRCSVIRIKVEADVSNSDVPVSDDEQRQDSTRYFEHHVKLLLSQTSDLERLSRSAASCQARLSRNARRQRSDGKVERFATQRVYDCGRVTAATRLVELLDNLSSAGFEVLETESEYVMFDSNSQIDRGWIELGTGV